MTIIDVQVYYRKLANNEALTEDEIVSLLKSVELFQFAAAHLAECQAATLENLPKATSKSARSRHVAICRTAAQLLDGNIHALRHRTPPANAKERCLRAIDEAEKY